MSEVTIIGNDLAKRVFQVHGARNDGSVVFRKKLSRGQVLAFFAQQPSCQPAVKRVTTPGERFGASAPGSAVSASGKSPLEMARR